MHTTLVESRILSVITTTWTRFQSDNVRINVLSNRQFCAEYDNMVRIRMQIILVGAACVWAAERVPKDILDTSILATVRSSSLL